MDADHRVTGPDLDGHGLAGEQREIHGRRTGLDHAVGGDLLAGPYDEPVTDRELLDRDQSLDPLVEHADLFRAELHQGTQRVRRPAACSAPRRSGRPAGTSSPPRPTRGRGGPRRAPPRPPTRPRRPRCRGRPGCPWCSRRAAALTAAARWNCQPDHHTTTPDRSSDHHSHPANRVAGTMPQRTTGTDSTTATSSRTGGGVGVASGVGAGSAASYPARRTASIRSSVARSGG